MSNFHAEKGSVRRSFGKVGDIVPVPNLIEIQSRSFNDFVQFDYLPSERQLIGLEKVLRDIFPIDHEGKLSLEYVSYELGNWACSCGKLSGIENRYQWQCTACKKSDCSRLNKSLTCTHCLKESARYKTCSNCLSRVVIQLPMTLEEARTSEQTFALPLKVKLQLVSWEGEGEARVVRDIKEQTIFFADLPIMCDLYEVEGRYLLGNLGTFLINGVDRVIVSQLHRSPGVVFSQSKKAKDYRGRPYYLARIIPMRGSWIDFEFDSNDLLYVRIDKKKKLLATTFLQALGFGRDKILSLFYHFDTILYKNNEFYRALDSSLIGQRIEKGMLDAGFEKLYLGRRVAQDMVDALTQKGVRHIVLKDSMILGRVLGEDFIDTETGEIIIEQGEVITEDYLSLIKKHNNISLKFLQTSGYAFQPSIATTLMHDKCMNEDEAIKEFHSKVFPGDTSSIREIKERIESLLFNNRFYDLTRVGRVRINRKLGTAIPEDVLVLTREDIIATLQYLVNLRERGEGELDDIDHLGNRRVRLVGELLNNQMYLGFMRIERIAREKFRMQEMHGAQMPQDFLNVKPLTAVLREFFGLGQLSQFMDQTNPLAEIAHKRRLSALGPGGVLKDRATFEIRDVHTSHYGRICPIETPEGQTVGLISSLATYAVVNDLGFIETAYRAVEDNAATDNVVFMDAFEEDDKYIAQADAFSVSENKDIVDNKKVYARYNGNFVQADAQDVQYVDLSPKQLVSVSAALIPFLEHDDAVRALMGANMQRQAVPLITTEAPLVGTGMEREIARGSGATVIAKRSGVVEYVSADKIVVRADEAEFHHEDEWVSQAIDTYSMKQFLCSSYSTWIHQRPVVKRGDHVKAGDALTDGPSIDRGELALGKNILVAFMPWHGYNFEDAIVISKRLQFDDVLTSVHIEEYDVEARDTKLGPEEITRDLPNVSEAALASLDEDGIVRIGTRVIPGDILVGKVTLKGDIQYSPEEKLLRAIFGEKSREVRDTSLRVPPGIEGTVIDVKIFSRSGIRKDKRYKQEVAKKVDKLEADYLHHVALLERMMHEKLVRELESIAIQTTGLKRIISTHSTLTNEQLVTMSVAQLFELTPKDKEHAKKIEHLKVAYETQLRVLFSLKEDRINKFRKGDSLPSGVIKVVKVYIAMKRAISVGDKIAGRHGNKGVVSTIIPREDMPCLADGTPVDVIFNPLGVPSRMNVGQIFETALGFAGKKLGEQLQELIATAGYADVKEKLFECYGKSLVESYEQEYGKDALFELARMTASKGIRFKTPVFDSASYDNDIRPLLQKLGMSVHGSYYLRDGRTGDYFDQPVTVGVMYVMKLNHMVDDKLHARSVGPYSLVTQQPLGGKAQQGGQRLGEMEVWALEAYGAAYTLQEMLTYKSDDVSGRHKAYSAIVRGEDVADPGVPESFNVLVKELQSLALQVDLLKVGKENQ